MVSHRPAKNSVYRYNFVLCHRSRTEWGNKNIKRTSRGDTQGFLHQNVTGGGVQEIQKPYPGFDWLIVIFFAVRRRFGK